MTSTLVKRIGRKALTPFLGKERLQPLFEALYHVALAGQNIGEGSSPSASGEDFVIDLAQHRVRDRPAPFVVFDVGANIGTYAEQVLRIATPPREIWCFEPSPSAFAILEERLDPYSEVRIFNIGFSDRIQRGILASAGPASKVASLHDLKGRLQRSGLTIALRESVELSTLDRFCEREGVDRIDLLKLDVEGHELSILRGATESLASGKIEAIQFEFGAANIDARTYFRDFYELLASDYSLFRVLQNGLWPVSSYNESHEVFKRATNYVALKRVHR